ncbi:10 kDa chaperonin 1, chloroplastic-like [Salvia splendens]|uniref:10 kDa chaperonin 1, chloroplastic-like n=1 Tax=Salvia splendens TaxID=180675 RepID=UPI001C267E6B|nr:10 kDa chaperonin 1, chloroplastic-like [Salvia splendens]
MASSFVTLSRPFASHTPNSHSLSPTPSVGGFSVGLKRRSLKLNAIATKYEPTKVVPQSDRVLIRLEVLPEKSAGGVLLPKSAVKFERYLVGEVVSVGTEAKEVETGKKVLFSDINAYEIDLGTEDRHIFCKASDLLAVVE